MKGSPEVAAIVAAFVERLDEVVERGSAAIRDSVPSYERRGEQLFEDVRESVRENVATLSQVLSRGRDIRADELRAIERVGARRAEGGIPLEDVLHAYRTVSRVCWDVLSEECRRYRGQALDATIELAEAVLRYTDIISTAVADAYARAQRTIVREQEGARREFLADLLYGTEASPADILRSAHTFGYDLSASYIALVGEGPMAEARRESLVSAAAANAAAGSIADPIVLQKGEQTIALVPVGPGLDPAVMPEKVVGELGEGWRFGVGGPELGLDGVRRAYIEAREALEIGTSLEMPGSIYRFDELLLYHFLRADPALVDRFVHLTLGPLLEHDEHRKGELINTLEAYFANDASIKAAGDALFAHPHTVAYRLKQIERVTGWSLRSAEDKLRLQAALRAYRLARARRDDA